MKRSSGLASAGSRKRGQDEEDDSMQMEEGEGGLVFEDPFGDDFEEEEIVDERGSDEEDEVDEEEGGGMGQDAPRVWRAGIDEVPEGEELEYDPSAYVCYHSLRTEWPCLTFDIVRDNLGDSRHRFPLTLFMMTGSQADRADKNKITIIKLSDISKTQKSPDSDDSDEDEDEGDDDEPTLEHIDVSHPGGVNRLRCMPQNSGVVATMSATGGAHVFDLTEPLASMMQHGPRAPPPTRPTFSFAGHRDEGYALDWSPVAAGQLLTGDCAGDIFAWSPLEAAARSWQVNPAPFRGHSSSVEDLQWSPSEPTVFSSASADKTIKIWDTRGKTGAQISVSAHDDDVNVLSWNHNVNYLLASGCEDGGFRVWDLRMIRQAQALANFSFHRGAISSIEWAPHDESMLAVSSADNQLTVWDLSVEADDPAGSSAAGGLEDYPPQLMFIHQGQQNVKELHHHPQIPGLLLSTAEDSFNVFKPSITVASN